MGDIFDWDNDPGEIMEFKRGKYTYRCVLTCPVCPEQWDVFIDEHVVGYLRLRWGHFKAIFPDYAGEIVYETTKITGDGTFGDVKERQRELKRAIRFIHREVKKKERYVPQGTVSTTSGGG
jgi:hypothetical protein